MRQHLTVNPLGIVCQVTRLPGSVRSAIARDVRFQLELKCNTGWHTLSTHDDRHEAARSFRETRRYRTFTFRLVAFNEAGRVVMPRNWQPHSYL